MEILKENLFENQKELKNDNFKIIEITKDSINKILMNILYYIEFGHKFFLLRYDYNKVKIDYEQIIKKLKVNIFFKLVKNHNIKIGFCGFPLCIFEKYILKPEIRWYFEKKILFSQKFLIKNQKFLKQENCKFCIYNDFCLGFSKNYLENFNEYLIEPIFSNKLLTNLYKLEIKNLDNLELQKFANQTLKKFSKEKHYLRQKLYFIKTFENSKLSNLDNKFIYYISNRVEDFEDNFKGLSKISNTVFLEKLKKYLYLSKGFFLNLECQNNKIIKRFYFHANDLNEKDLEEISKILEIDFNFKQILSIGITYEKEEKVYEILYDYEKISKDELKKYVSDFDLKYKRRFLKFVNSLTKPLNHCFLSCIIKNNKIISKKIFVSTIKNYFRPNSFAAIFGVNFKHFQDKNLEFLSYQISYYKEEIINFYYTLFFKKFLENQQNINQKDNIEKNIEKIENIENIKIIEKTKKDEIFLLNQK